ncbi:hypothetical protein AVEN_264449-1 [Araneus ventricosus]|uniref:Uncharacterized protein n=1 Tax=Araneus ventricosus TaxID=182803 RepID=A0A4Y2K3J1_ARAVE|nr:hypothetical protein AVEN_264449-1 [Araneus ventricosus]
MQALDFHCLHLSLRVDQTYTMNVSEASRGRSCSKMTNDQFAEDRFEKAREKWDFQSLSSCSWNSTA